MWLHLHNLRTTQWTDTRLLHFFSPRYNQFVEPISLTGVGSFIDVCLDYLDDLHGFGDYHSRPSTVYPVPPDQVARSG